MKCLISLAKAYQFCREYVLLFIYTLCSFTSVGYVSMKDIGMDKRKVVVNLLNCWVTRAGLHKLFLPHNNLDDISKSY